MNCGQCKHRVRYRNEFFQCEKFVPVPGRVRMIVEHDDEPINCPGAEPKGPKERGSSRPG